MVEYRVVAVEARPDYRLWSASRTASRARRICRQMPPCGGTRSDMVGNVSCWPWPDHRGWTTSYRTTSPPGSRPRSSSKVFSASDKRSAVSCSSTVASLHRTLPSPSLLTRRTAPGRAPRGSSDRSTSIVDSSSATRTPTPPSNRSTTRRSTSVDMPCHDPSPAVVQRGRVSVVVPHRGAAAHEEPRAVAHPPSGVEDDETLAR